MTSSESPCPPPFYETWWFEWVVLLFCLGIGWLIWQTLGHPTPINTIEDIPALQVAQSILSGHGKSIFQPTANFPYLGQSPLYPVLLALTMLLTRNTQLNPDLIFSFKVLNFSLYIISIFLAYKFCNDRIEKPFSTLITVLYAFSPLILHAANHITADMAYIVFSLSAILCFDKFISEQGAEISRGPLFWCCFFTALSILTSNLGFSLLFAFTLLALKHFGFKRGAKITLLLLTVLIPCYFLEWSENPAAFTNLLSPAQYSAIIHPHGILMGIAENTDRLLEDITNTVLGTLDLNLFSSSQTAPIIHFNHYPAIRCLLGLLMVIGVSFGFSQYTGISSFYILFYLILSWIWPLQDGNTALPALIPVLPILLLYIFLGMQLLGEVFDKFNLPVTQFIAPLLSGILIIVSGIGVYQLVHGSFYASGQMIAQQVNRIGLSIPTLGKNSQSAISQSDGAKKESTASLEEIQGYDKAYSWLKDHTTPSNQIIGANPQELSSHIQRPVRTFLTLDKPDQVVRDLLQANYIFVDKHDPAVRKYLVPAIVHYKEFFHLAYRDRKARLSIWEVPPLPTPAQIGIVNGAATH